MQLLVFEMPFVFSISGVMLIIAGVRGKTSDLMLLVKSDFTGQPNYFEWMIAIFLVGAIGYVKELSTISRMFMFLVLAGLLYKNQQVFSEFTTEEKQTAPQQSNVPFSSSQQPLTQTSTQTTQQSPLTAPTTSISDTLDNLLSMFKQTA